MKVLFHKSMAYLLELGNADCGVLNVMYLSHQLLSKCYFGKVFFAFLNVKEAVLELLLDFWLDHFHRRCSKRSRVPTLGCLHP